MKTYMGDNMIQNKVENEKLKFLYKKIFIVLSDEGDKNTKKNKIIELIDGAIK